MKSNYVEGHVIINVLKLSTLTSLDLSDIIPWGGELDLRDFEKMTSLKELNLSGFTFNAEQIEQVNYATISSLEKLTLDRANAKKFNFTAYAPNVKHLSLSKSNISPLDVSNISNLLNLGHLNLASTNMSLTCIVS